MISPKAVSDLLEKVEEKIKSYSEKFLKSNGLAVYYGPLMELSWVRKTLEEILEDDC